MAAQRIDQAEEVSPVPGIESMDFIRSGWHGYSALWGAFWIYGIFFSFIIAALVSLAEQPGYWAELAALLIGIAWYVWSNVAIWRCAGNTYWKGWGLIARLFVFTNVVVSIGGFILALVDIFTGAA